MSSSTRSISKIRASLHFQKRCYALKPRGPLAVDRKKTGVYGRLHADLMKQQYPESYPEHLTTKQVMDWVLNEDELKPIDLRGLSASDRYQIKKFRNKLVMIKTRRNVQTQEKEKLMERDELSRVKFQSWRRAVLDYRKHKRAMALENICYQEDMQEVIRMETNRHKRTKRLKRYNKEAMHETFRVSALRNLTLNVDQMVTPENLDEHILKELDPSRSVMHTVFAGMTGVHDEVDYDFKKEKSFNNQDLPSHLRTFEDPLFPTARVHPVNEDSVSKSDYQRVKDTRDLPENHPIFKEGESTPEQHKLDFSGKKPTVVATNTFIKREKKTHKRTDILKDYAQELLEHMENKEKQEEEEDDEL